MVYPVDIVDSSALPWLGEQFSLFGDGWELAESDDVRRALIKSAIELHPLQGDAVVNPGDYPPLWFW